MVKKNQWNLIFIFISMLLQSYYFYQQSGQCAFIHLIGVEVKKNQGGIPYLEICFLCLPIYFMILYFREHYSFTMENYGRLLLIRGCMRWNVFLKMYKKMVLYLLGILGVQWVLNFLFFYQYFIKNRELLCKSMVLYAVTILLLITLEILLCSFLEERIVEIILNIYVFLSSMGLWMIQKDFLCLLFPGKVVFMKYYIEKICTTRAYGVQIIMDILLVIGIVMISMFRYKKQDIF